MITLTTQRFVLRPLQMDDIEALHQLWTTPEVREFLWNGEVVSRERTASIVTESIRLFEEKRSGLWGGFRPNEDSLIGFAGFWYFRDPPELELLYGVANGLWRQGVATELAQAIVSYGFSVLHLSEIQASTDFPNRASQRVLEKLGFLLERRDVVDGLDTIFYRLPRSVS
jgi:ribosomal-protein-alanine N-acetyltransferase